MPPACFCLAESQRGSAIAPPLLKNLQIAEGSNQVLKGLQISMAPAQRSKQLAPIWCCLAQEKGRSASQLQRAFNSGSGVVARYGPASGKPSETSMIFFAHDMIHHFYTNQKSTCYP